MLLPHIVGLYRSIVSILRAVAEIRLIAITIIERFGRRPLMLWTALAQAGTMAVLAGLYNIEKAGNKGAQGVSVLCLFLFNTWFSIGWLGMTW